MHDIDESFERKTFPCILELYTGIYIQFCSVVIGKIQEVCRQMHIEQKRSFYFFGLKKSLTLLKYSIKNMFSLY